MYRECQDRRDDLRAKSANRRKKVLRNRRIAISFILIIVMILITSIATANGETKREPKCITVRSGDTLWSIASVYRKPGQDVRRLIKEIKELNNLPSSIIYAGDNILVP